MRSLNKSFQCVSLDFTLKRQRENLLVVDLSIFFLYYNFFFFRHIRVLSWIPSVFMEFWLLTSTQAAFGNKMITKATCNHFFVVWSFFSPFSLLHVTFCLTFLHSSVAIRLLHNGWIDEGMTGIQIQVFHFFVAGVLIVLWICIYLLIKPTPLKNIYFGGEYKKGRGRQRSTEALKCTLASLM